VVFNKSISGSTVCPNGFGNNARYPSSNINLKWGVSTSSMIVREGIPNYHADKDIHVLASLFETMPDSPMSKLSQVIELRYPFTNNHGTIC
jgi:hypothetical protein